MDHSSPSWPTHLLRAIPPLSDGVCLGFLLFLVVILGLVASLTWCLHTQHQAVSRLSVQHQLDALDKRLKALESP